MNVSIHFPADIESSLLRRAAAAGKDVETIVREFVTERLAEEGPSPTEAASHDEFMARLDAIIRLHPVSNGSVDDSRESIYAGRGE
jgi:plasmid stability protein